MCVLRTVPSTYTHPQKVAWFHCFFYWIPLGRAWHFQFFLYFFPRVFHKSLVSKINLNFQNEFQNIIQKLNIAPVSLPKMNFWLLEAGLFFLWMCCPPKRSHYCCISLVGDTLLFSLSQALWCRVPVASPLAVASATPPGGWPGFYGNPSKKYRQRRGRGHPEPLLGFTGGLKSATPSPKPPFRIIFLPPVHYLAGRSGPREGVIYEGGSLPSSQISLIFP